MVSVGIPIISVVKGRLTTLCNSVNCGVVQDQPVPI